MKRYYFALALTFASACLTACGYSQQKKAEMQKQSEAKADSSVDELSKELENDSTPTDSTTKMK